MPAKISARARHELNGVVAVRPVQRRRDGVHQADKVSAEPAVNEEMRERRERIGPGSGEQRVVAVRPVQRCIRAGRERIAEIRTDQLFVVSVEPQRARAARVHTVARSRRQIERNPGRRIGQVAVARDVGEIDGVRAAGIGEHHRAEVDRRRRRRDRCRGRRRRRRCIAARAAEELIVRPGEGRSPSAAADERVPPRRRESPGPTGRSHR